MAASTADPAALRRRPWQTRPYLRLLAMVALLGSPAWAAAVDPYSIQIKPTAVATASPSVPVVEAPIPTSIAQSMHAQVLDQNWDLKRRAEDGDETSSSTGKQSSSSGDNSKTSSDDKKTTSASGKSSSGSKTATASDSESMTTFTVSIRTSTSVTASNSPLPSAFDDSIPSDFKLSSSGSSCPTFMSDLLNHQTFKDCLPNFDDDGDFAIVLQR